MWSTKLANTEVTPAQRLAAARIMPVIEVISKACMSLMLTVGGILTELRGIDHYWWQMPAIIILGPIWLTLTLMVFFKSGTETGVRLARYDVWFRWLVVVSVSASSVFALVTGRLDDAPWVVGKLLLFAAVVLFGLLMRQRLAPLQDNLDKLEAEGPTPEVNTAISRCIGQARVFMFATWAGLIMAGAMGVFQPGAPESPVGQMSQVVDVHP